MEVKRMKVKVCLIGEAAVGKTSLIRRFVLDNFDDKYIQTLGTKVSKKELASPSPDGTVDLKDQLQITEDEMVQAARAYDSPFHFTSAKAGVNVETAFQSLAERVAKERYARKVVAEE